jgi:hypothetical protein
MMVLADSASKSVTGLAIHWMCGNKQNLHQLIRSSGLLCPLRRQLLRALR